jgi:uncharacterized protein YfcZ (UPF0381/DUF406 family)
MAFDVNKGQNNSCAINAKGDQYVECTECGATAEIGTIIHANDNLAEGVITSDDKHKTIDLYDKYVALAKSITEEVVCNCVDSNEGKVRNYSFNFTCTAEKMIFEMRVRSIK